MKCEEVAQTINFQSCIRWRRRVSLHLQISEFGAHSGSVLQEV